eukprot:1948837-Pleurochrysis_carterae.AAC.5
MHGPLGPLLDSQSCFQLRLLALGTRMKDDRAGAEQLLAGTPVHFELFFAGDFAGVRAIENFICGCRPEAMHAVPAAEA